MARLIWITGLAGSGKTTLAKEVYNQLKKAYPNVVLIDGDHLREIFGGSTGYTSEERLENAKRLSRLCHFLVNENIHVVCATLIHRDKNKLYSSALEGKTENVVGINQDYDKPSDPFLTIPEFNLKQLPEIASSIIQKVNL